MPGAQARVLPSAAPPDEASGQNFPRSAVPCNRNVSGRRTQLVRIDKEDKRLSYEARALREEGTKIRPLEQVAPSHNRVEC